MSKIVGCVFKSVCWGDVVVVESLGRKAVIQFLNTGNLETVYATALYKGEVCDKAEKARIKEVKAEEARKIAEEKEKAKLYKPTIYGVGYMGEGDQDKNTPLYNSWVEMIRRCYSANWDNKFNGSRKEYEVAEEWKCYNTFRKDAMGLEGYEQWVNGIGAFSIKPGHRLHSKDTCHFYKSAVNKRIK